MSLYDTGYIGTTANRITLNDFTTTPVYRLISRQPQRRQVRELDIPIPFESGISDFETLIGQTAYIIEGIMYPGSESEFDSGLAALRKLASLEISQDDNLSDDGYVPYIWSEFTTTKQLFLKVLYVDVREDTRKGLVQPFRLICKVKDPTIHSYTLHTASTGSFDSAEASGDSEYSFEYPVVYGASLYSVTSNANNAGDLPAYPQAITVYGPVSDPKITNATTGEYIQVNTTLSSGSNVLSIVYDKDSLSVTVDGVSVLPDVTSASTYFKLQPGGNDITLEGTTVSTGAYATVSFYDAWPLS